MKVVSIICLCALMLLASGCQNLQSRDLQTHLARLDFNLDSASYIARAGETLESIATRYATSEATLRQLNPAAINGVHTGMEIIIRAPESRSIASRTFANRTADNTLGDIQPTVNAAQTSPTYQHQAVPVAAVATDQYLLGSERFNRGFPEEEVIEDESFVIPGSSGGRDGGYADLPTGWLWPLDGQLARDYDPGRPNGRGIEIVGIPGDEVRAARNGVVDWVARSPDGVGKVVIIRHDDDYLSIYSNTQDLFVSKDDTVQQGDPIASLGANANDEPLLRFEISKDGNLLNPMNFLMAR